LIQRIYEQYARQVWEAEQSLPAYFRMSGTECTFETFLKWWRGCEIYGTFRDNKLIATLCLEYSTDTSILCHSSVLDRNRIADIRHLFAVIKKEKIAAGIAVIDCWILKQNRQLKQVVEAIGFANTNLEQYIASNGKVRCFELFRAV
jgi:hypothetical protein